MAAAVTIKDLKRAIAKEDDDFEVVVEGRDERIYRAIGMDLVEGRFVIKAGRPVFEYEDAH